MNRDPSRSELIANPKLSVIKKEHTYIHTYINPSISWYDLLLLGVAYHHHFTSCGSQNVASNIGVRVETMVTYSNGKILFKAEQLYAIESTHLDSADTKGTIPITVKIDNAGKRTSKEDGGPSKKMLSGSKRFFFKLFLSDPSASSSPSANISLSLKSPFAHALIYRQCYYSAH